MSVFYNMVIIWTPEIIYYIMVLNTDRNCQVSIHTLIFYSIFQDIEPGL